MSPGSCGNNFKSRLFTLIMEKDNLGTHYEIVFMWMPQNLTDKKSTLTPTMALPKPMLIKIYVAI